MTPRQKFKYWNMWRQVLVAHDWTRLTKAEQDALRHQAHARVNNGRTFSSATATNAQLSAIYAEFSRLAGGGSLEDGLQLTAGDKPQRGVENPNLSRQYRHSILNKILPSFIGILHEPNDPISYCESIMKDKFNTTDLNKLNTWELYQLVCTLNRCRNELLPVTIPGMGLGPNYRKPAPEPEPASTPF